MYGRRFSIETHSTPEMIDPQSRFEELTGRFSERGLRLTPQRVALLRLLAESRGHPSAGQLHEQLSQ